MFCRVALLFIVSSSALAATLPCDKVQFWHQIALLKKLDQSALKSKAVNGNVFAQYFLGTKYLENRNANGAESSAIYWIRQAADHGFSRAQLLLGEFYESGQLIPQDRDEALALYLRAARQGDCEGEFVLAMHYLGRQFDSTSKTWKYDGEKDVSSAVLWLQRASEHGNPDAAVELGQLYEQGDGVAQDYAAAASFYREAAEQVPDLGGAGQGRNDLGLLYLDGHGVPQDYTEAYKWFALSPSPINLQDAAARMTAAQIEEAQRRVDEWKQQHAATLKQGSQVFAEK